MSDPIDPGSEQELMQAVLDAASGGNPLDIRGSGSKRDAGRPLQTERSLTTRRLSGITLYRPTELVVSAQAGTTVKDVEAELAEKGQQLAFEPLDLGPFFGRPAGQTTVGGMIATNMSGARRILSGSARDHLLGIRAVNGRGEVFKSGGRVMKNVTGYDLCKLLCGSWGTLGVLSEVTLKVLPSPRATATLVFRGLADQVAVRALCDAMKTPFEVSGTAHIHRSLVGNLTCEAMSGADSAITAMRVEGFQESVDDRIERLGKVLIAYGEADVLDTQASQGLWSDIRELRAFSGTEGAVWRLTLPPISAADVVDAVSLITDCRACYDWSGGLIWLELPAVTDGAATEVRRIVAQYRGSATLMRADAALRASANVFPPLPETVERLTRNIKAAFDPKGILNPGRMYAGH